VLLFDRVAPLGVAWLRIATAAAVYAVWRRPWRTWRARPVAALGIVLALMNPCFYLAIDRLPLATVAAIEVLPVIALASLGARSPRNALALAAAVAGVCVLTDVRLAGEPVGFVFAFLNATLFALYIVTAHRVSRESGIDGLAAAMLVARVVVTPIGGWRAAPARLDPVALGAGIGVGVTSSVVPYVFDQLAMARMPRATYALLVSLLPATAGGDRLTRRPSSAIVVVLRQIPSPIEIAAVALVVAGTAIHRES
jgi:inner membrane transporter RhtA